MELLVQLEEGLSLCVIHAVAGAVAEVSQLSVGEDKASCTEESADGLCVGYHFVASVEV